MESPIGCELRGVVELFCRQLTHQNESGDVTLGQR